MVKAAKLKFIYASRSIHTWVRFGGKCGCDDVSSDKENIKNDKLKEIKQGDKACDAWTPTTEWC